MAEQISAMADAAAPYCSGVLEHLGAVAFAERQVSATVYNVPNAPGAIAISTEINSVGLIAWLLRDQLIAKINAEIDADSDDGNALTQEQRQEQQAVIDADLLEIERQLAKLIWQMRADGGNAEFDAKLSPRAILGIEVVAGAPQQEPGFVRTSFPPGARR